MTESKITDPETRAAPEAVENSKPLAFSPEQRKTLAIVLDSIVPASEDGCMPSAGDLGIEGSVEQALDATPELKAMIAEGLAMLTTLAAERDPRGFDALSASRRAEIVEEAGLPPVLVLQTYASYYRHPRVLEALGMETRAPHPQGYAMKENDLSLLEPVRRRRPLFRSA